MYPRHLQQNLKTKQAKQRGSMLVIALFVIIVLALLGLTMTRLFSSSSETIIYEVLGQRALNAARSGVECALAEQFGDDCSHPISKELKGVAGLENCTYRVSESIPKTITDGGKTFSYLTFSSRGQCRAGLINVTRFVYVDAMLEVNL